jgi:S-adenosylmethionine:tRNA ribosyltransferase-isomerase
VYRLGDIPLPPYIRRQPTDADRRDYQTVYARDDGSVASPTAGLHFTESLMDTMRARGVAFAPLVLHIGYATFRPIHAEDVVSHPMGREAYTVPQETLRQVASARSGGKKVCAVGTTSCRALESAVVSGSSEGDRTGETDLYITPGYEWRAVNTLLTNFHLPRTTLLVLVHAFAGSDLMREAYRQAVERGYRFYSYGDAMLIL